MRPPRLLSTDFPVLRAAVVLVVAVAAAYANSFRGPFVFDDIRTLAENPTIRAFSSALFPPANGMTTSGRPLANLSFALNYALSGSTVWSYHALNLAVHVLAALTLFGLVRRTLAQRRDSSANAIAFTAALLWALHPLQTESVTYLVQRTEALCALCLLLTLYCGARAFASGSRRWAALSVAACFGGMACKEVMAAAPLLVLLYDRAFFAGSFGAALRARPRYYAALAASWLLLAALVLHSGDRGGSAGFATTTTPLAYALTQLVALPRYLGLAFVPRPLVFDYGTATVTGGLAVFAGAVLLLALLGATAIALRRAPALGFLGAAFFLILAPSSSVVPIATQTIAEHRMYLPLAVVALLVAVGLHRLSPRVALPVASLLALSLGTATFARNRDYRDATTLWADTAAKRPANPRAHYNLGLAQLAAGQPEDAAASFRRAVALRSDYAQAHDALGLACARLGRIDEAIRHATAAVQFAPHLAAPHINLGAALAQAGRTAEAIAAYADAARLEPTAADVHAQWGLLLARNDRAAEALGPLEAAVRLAPDNAAYLANLGNALLVLGRVDEAIARYEAALQRDPANTRLRANLDLARETRQQRR